MIDMYAMHNNQTRLLFHLSLFIFEAVNAIKTALVKLIYPILFDASLKMSVSAKNSFNFGTSNP